MCPPPDQVEPLSKDGEKAENFPEHFLPGSDLPKINTDKLKEKADAEREKRKEAMGQDVSIEAQDVFDAISRTYVTTHTTLLLFCNVTYITRLGVHFTKLL